MMQKEILNYLVLLLELQFAVLPPVRLGPLG